MKLESLALITPVFGIFTNILPTLMGMLFILGALLVGFSKEKREDEFISNLRLSSLLWAVCLNYILLFSHSFLFMDFHFL